MDTGRVVWIKADEAPADWRDGRHLLGWHPDELFPGPLIVSWSDIFCRWITEDRVDVPVSHVAQVNAPD